MSTHAPALALHHAVLTALLRFVLSLLVAVHVVGCIRPYPDSGLCCGRDTGDTGDTAPKAETDELLAAVQGEVAAPPPPSSTPPRSASGFYSPINVALNYDCKYGSYFTTLFLDNEDGGATAAATAGYNASLCDSYDATSGSKYNGQYCGAHTGVDISVASGTPVYAITSGTVSTAFSSCTSTSGTLCNHGWGNDFIVKSSVYSGSTLVNIYVTDAHLTSIGTNPATGRTWAVGEAISAGALIGLSGNTGNSTGPHLHFQIDKDFSTTSHPFWSTNIGWSGVSKPDYSNTMGFTGYVYNPLYAIGFGTCS